MPLPKRTELAEGMTSSGYFEPEILRQRKVWDNKSALRCIYQQWYSQVAKNLPEKGLVVELGCGVGGFKQWRPNTIATDLVPSPWVDLVTDGTRLPFVAGALDGLVAFDVLHHIANPVSLFQEAVRVLRPGGKLIFWEPAITPWSRVVWALFHHEPVDMNYDPFAVSNEPSTYFANTALPALLFEKFRDRLQQEVPALRLETLAYSDCLVYPLTGGFSPFCLLPPPVIPALHRLESALFSFTARRLTGMRLMAVLQRI
jgi:SAM-dependent methyltransferase